MAQGRCRPPWVPSVEVEDEPQAPRRVFTVIGWIWIAALCASGLGLLWSASYPFFGGGLVVGALTQLGALAAAVVWVAYAIVWGVGRASGRRWRARFVVLPLVGLGLLVGLLAFHIPLRVRFAFTKADFEAAAAEEMKGEWIEGRWHPETGDRNHRPGWDEVSGHAVLTTTENR